jgi:tRNA pseudouridine32 synthase / 23S rRNA pseudouridine746 synthase
VLNPESNTPKIIELDSNWVVVEKPSGWLSVPSRYAEDDIRPVVGKFVEAELGKRIYPVHRLDFEVSGLLLFALSAETHRAFSVAFEQRKIIKTYEALTTGSELPHFEFFRDKMAKGKKRAYSHAAGKDAVTEILEAKRISENGILWRLRPQTGRPHQLRFQLASRGFPILNDTLYGGNKTGAVSMIALRATQLDASALQSADIAKLLRWSCGGLDPSDWLVN